MATFVLLRNAALITNIVVYDYTWCLIIIISLSNLIVDLFSAKKYFRSPLYFLRKSNQKSILLRNAFFSSATEILKILFKCSKVGYFQKDCTFISKYIFPPHFQPIYGVVINFQWKLRNNVWFWVIPYAKTEFYILFEIF